LTFAVGASAAPAEAPALAWSVTPNPFQLSFSTAGAPLVSEADASAGPGGRLSYRLADGSFHGLGALLASTPIPGGTEYHVATDEPTRAAIVDVTRTPTSRRRSSPSRRRRARTTSAAASVRGRST